MTAGCIDAVVFTQNLDPGGPARMTANLLARMSSGAVRARAVVCRGDGAARAWLPPDVELEDLGARRLSTALPALRAHLRARPPDVVLSLGADATILLRIAVTGLRHRPPVVARETTTLLRPGKSHLLRGAAREAYGRCALVLAPTEGLRDELIEHCGLDPQTTWTVPEAVDVLRIGTQADAARRTRAPWGERAGPVVVAHGRLVPVKGMDILVRAFARLSDDVRLVIVGDGPERAALDGLARAAGCADRVSFVGHREDAVDFIAHADVFAFTSRNEGCPHALIEAMACGAAIVAADCRHGPRELLRGGEAGVLVPTEDPGATADAIRALIADAPRRRALGHVARSAAARFDAVLVAATHARILVDVAHRRAARPS